MQQARKRVVAGMGPETFRTEVLNKFGLILTDDMVTQVAEEIGWNNQWLSTRQTRTHTPVLSQDITRMMHNLGRAPLIYARAAVAC